MPHTCFAANSKISGGCAFFKLVNNESFMLSVFKQSANNANKKNNFDFTTGINVKFSPDEIGGFLRAIRTDGSFNFYHSSEFEGNKSVTKGNFNFFSVEQPDNKPARLGFGLTVDKNGTVTKVSYSVGAAESLAEFLRTGLTSISYGIIDEDKLKDQEYLNSKKQSVPAEPVAETPVKSQKSKKVEPKSEPVAVAAEDNIDF